MHRDGGFLMSRESSISCFLNPSSSVASASTAPACDSFDQFLLSRCEVLRNELVDHYLGRFGYGRGLVEAADHDGFVRACVAHLDRELDEIIPEFPFPAIRVSDDRVD